MDGINKYNNVANYTKKIIKKHGDTKFVRIKSEGVSLYKDYHKKNDKNVNCEDEKQIPIKRLN